jgi:hypothetical protein
MEMRRQNGTQRDSAGLSGTGFLGLGALTWATRNSRTWGGQNAGFTRRGMEKSQVSGYSDGLGWAHCKTVGLAYVGKAPG